MTVKETAARLHVSESTVRRWCREGFALAPGVYAKKANGKYDIPKSANRPYIVSKKNLGSYERRKHMLRAVDTECYLAPTMLGASEALFRAELKELAESGFISPFVKKAGLNTANYRLPIARSEWYRKNYPSGGEITKSVIDKYIEMAIGALAKTLAGKN